LLRNPFLGNGLLNLLKNARMYIMHINLVKYILIRLKVQN
jgi:hypothetical protein